MSQKVLTRAVLLLFVMCSIGAIVICSSWAIVSAQAQSEGLAYLSPIALVADSAGTHVYVVDKTGSQVVEVDVPSSKAVRNIPLPGHPTGAALNKAGDRLYVTADVPSNSVFVVDLRSGKVESVLPAGHGAMAPVLSSDESTLYVCNRFNDNA